MNLTDSIQFLKGVGPKSAERYQQLGIFTVSDLLTYFPFRYDDFAAKPIFELIDGEKTTIVGTVVTPANVSYYGARRNRLVFKIKQGEAVISVSFFNQPYLQNKVELDAEIAIYGKWDAKKMSITGMKILAQVENSFQPVYHVMQGIKQSALVTLLQAVFDAGVGELITENLPESLLQKYRLVDRKTAVHDMHFPIDESAHHQALRRMKFEELFYFQLKLQALRLKDKALAFGLTIKIDEQLLAVKISRLPFTLTGAQSQSLREILADMASPYHMNRLLQGDVGSGKTVVASLAMYAAVQAGFQAALMVPTEILANQHYESLQELFPELSVGLLTGGMKTAERRLLLAGLEDGSIQMVTGTHALIQDAVNYQSLGLVITDEQHRFGVKQRRVFREKGQNPDVLMMTATPIPRTLAITAFGDMDVSIINELPAGRKPITTRWVKHEQLTPSILPWVADEVHKGAQVYFISPLIEESEMIDLKNATDLFEELTAFFGDKARVALLHGRLKNAEKDQIMLAFKAKKYDVLVSTTVIEVGVNVPNATIMVIMDADRFGLSQLHQLRGRVGRGEKKSYTILVANPKSDGGKRRMQIMTETQNGFVLAEEDLKMRGSGEIFGTRQSGLPEFSVADIVNDYPILEVAREEAVAIYQDPQWSEKPENQLLVASLTEDDVFD
ncbi:ATP-dependent DNA helicase RecG [Lactococcus piscium]|uniref:ATP-dependent DNA helicase RecG n=1 Tax=Pseudolactococcus paracarnosus TaxID=2749962 RepID=A0A7L4WAE1_9LACT|nr:ATP-dependent DNA helicase RecG [Lactococcus paracarnosus]MCJ1994473.1 ATP-dependent DNA helicase RecG [Lactococcus paracarnosus]QDJ27306.1 ATP-dependent DNA helicase RecG [Lactococcus paracarnosus]SPC38011.1 branch migrating ATP-dependent DNA helicase involved in DNA recombination and repair [Lactococcus piscium]